MSTVLVTGGSGFVGSHCILQLAAAGHTVRTTVRNLNREASVRALLREGGGDPGDGLSFFAANLESGRAFLDLDRAADALPYLERAAAIEPASSTAQMLLGKTLLRVGRTQEGERIVSQARKRWDAANQGSSSVK